MRPVRPRDPKAISQSLAWISVLSNDAADAICFFFLSITPDRTRISLRLAHTHAEFNRKCCIYAGDRIEGSVGFANDCRAPFSLDLNQLALDIRNILGRLEDLVRNIFQVFALIQRRRSSGIVHQQQGRLFEGLREERENIVYDGTAPTWGGEVKALSPEYVMAIVSLKGVSGGLFGEPPGFQ